MLQLPNGCTCSEPSVFPKNWKAVSASVKQDWRIQFYFRDPNFRKSKLIVIKGGMNRFKDVHERREVVKVILEEEIKSLKNGYNPILGSVVKPANDATFDIEENTPFIIAIDYAFKKLNLSEASIISIRSAIKYIELAANVCGYSSLPVSAIKRKHVIKILEACKEVKDQWSAQTYNHYRAYLMQLFRIMVRVQAIENNPVDADLPKEDVEVNIRELITFEERKRIHEHFEYDKYFQRFLHVFFHSGARPVELTRLKKESVNVEKLYYKIKVRKRKKIVEEKRSIKKIVVHLWQEIMDECNVGDFLFGRLLQAGPKVCPRDYITKKWQKEVKGIWKGKKIGGLGINKDLYALKHTNLDETSAILDAEAAARQAGHKSTVITLKHYLVNEEERARERLSNVANKFA